MTYQNVFQRTELKYLLTKEQRQLLLQAMELHMSRDPYGRTTIRNIYFDTDTYRLIRRSMEKPVYKEKLRVRSYDRAEPDSTVFVELKKKYQSIVYKRRISLSEHAAMDWLCGHPCSRDTEISREITYFLDYYETLHPVGFLTYEREAYCSDRSDLRVTFDDAVLFRQEDISLASDVYGTPLLPEGMTLMEVKCSGGIPHWLTDILSKERLYKTSFSKYGTAYQKIIFSNIQRRRYADV